MTAPTVPEFIRDSSLWRAFPEGGTQNTQSLRAVLTGADDALEQAFGAGADTETLVHGRAAVMDRVLTVAAGDFVDGTALVAVGGYGRGELHPHSDIDLLFLLAEPPDKAFGEALGRLITLLWDLGLQVGHSVRTVAQCVEDAAADITVATALMEARLLLGDRQLFETMRQRTAPAHVWPSRDFFAAKLKEQQARHRKFGDTAYRLEPNLKEGPGGLRDIQMVGWVAKRHFAAISLHDLVEQQFLTENEHHTLLEGQAFLWRIRFALHRLAGRCEDRLLFDHQLKLAELFGYSDQDHNLAVEQFMQRYYRWVMELERLNEMLLQHYQEAILLTGESAAPTPINRRFQAYKGFLDVTHDKVFERYPYALLEIFLVIAQHRELKGVRASTIRLIRQHRHRIDDKFRRDIVNRSLFMEILRQPGGISHEFRRMNRYGVLAAYWPSFGKIVGRMQYDLFHVYTVDEHTMFVLRNVRRFAVEEWAHDLPFCTGLFKQIPKPEVLYLAVLFHDVAKGRGGDHSELGAEEAETFCLEHGLGSYDAQLVAWLVRHHLILSVTAQRYDISDPVVINRFAEQVGTTIRLDYLYLLTIADIRGTNPELWNDWKNALLTELYHATKYVLRRGLDKPLQRPEVIENTRRAAYSELADYGVREADCNRLWERFDEDYFLRHSGDEIAWHTQAILKAGDSDAAQVLIRPQTDRGCTEIFVHTPDRAHLFAHIAAALTRLGLDILDARIITTRTGETLDTFLVLKESGEPVNEGQHSEEIVEALLAMLRDIDAHPIDVSRPPPRALRSFKIPLEVNFTNEPQSRYTILEVLMADHPGLLARIGRAFIDCHVIVHNARISTIGARAEDLFYVTDTGGQKITDPQTQENIRASLQRHLQELETRHWKLETGN
ncbi:MAG: [protein-PII] uridylyltransferase [Gammaproteobacteria bacterium]